MASIFEAVRRFIVKPVSVGLDAAVSIGTGVILYLLLGVLLGDHGLAGGLKSAAAGVGAAMFYMRARTNLVDPTPAFAKKP